MAVAAPGDLDALDLNLTGSQPNIAAVALQPDAKLIIGGSFDSVLGVPRNNIARINASGTLDASFYPKTSSAVTSVAVQPDGRILLGGGFTYVWNGTDTVTSEHKGVARVHADGTLEKTFNPGLDGSVNTLALQPDGRIVIGGVFNSIHPAGAPAPDFIGRCARLNADGTIDTGFKPTPNGVIWSTLIQPDGKILIGGNFHTVRPNGAPAAIDRGPLVRLNPDGTLDTPFDPRVSAAGVLCLGLQPDGKILLAGYFTTLKPNGSASVTGRRGVARVNADGSLDTVFNPGVDGLVYSLALQADGKVLLAGEFGYYWPHDSAAQVLRPRILRLNTNGTLDSGFNILPNTAVRSVALQPDGKVLLGGLFNRLQPNGATAPVTRNHFARLFNDPAAQILTIPDTGTVRWHHSGAGPNITGVTFHLSRDDGVNWIPLGPGSRIGNTANWQITGLALAGTGKVSARGVVTDGNNTGIIGQTADFSFPADTDHDGLPDSWELTYWPTLSGHSAADDFDHDGYTELLELALGLHPTVPDPGGLPTVTTTGGYLTMTLTKQRGVTCEAQSAGTVLPHREDSFSADSIVILRNDETTLQVRDSIPLGSGAARFMRLRVTAAP